MLTISSAIWASKREGEETGAFERKLLRQIGKHDALEELGVEMSVEAFSALERGKWIAERVSKVGAVLVQSFEEAGVSAGRAPADKASYLWGLALSEGLTLDELCTRCSDLFTSRASNDRLSLTAIKNRIRGAMWLPGNHPLRLAQPGIERVFFRVISSLQEKSARQRWMQSATFDYEWKRLENFPAERQLMSILAFFAAYPVPMALIEDAWEALPTKLRREIHDHGNVEAVVRSLESRELVSTEQRAIVVSERTRIQVLKKLDSKAATERGTSQAVRILKAGLPPDTHHHTAWSSWRASLPHVEAAIQRSTETHVGTEYAAYLLDRASVFVRQAEDDALKAAQYAERAVSVAESDGCPDARQYAIYLANHAMALSNAQERESAISQMDKSLQVTKATIGEVSEEFAGSLNVKANMLKYAKRSKEALEAHELSLQTIRLVLAVHAQPSHEVQSTFMEILNDYAADLLQSAPSVEHAKLAMELLNEADSMLEKGDYGWGQVQLNLANALKQKGDLKAAMEKLDELVCYTEEAYGPTSFELYAVLRDLSDVLNELGHPRYEEVYMRAHEIDDQLGPYGEDPELG
jgi:tetratricopeptide (TPR) repeat protein